MVIPPALLNEPYIAGSEGDWDTGAEGEDGNESEDSDEEPKQSEQEIQNTPTQLQCKIKDAWIALKNIKLSTHAESKLLSIQQLVQMRNPEAISTTMQSNQMMNQQG